MRTCVGILLSVAVAPWCVAAEPYFASELIFPPQDKHCHGSSIVQLPDGSFIAAWFYGSGERSANDVKIQGARLKKGAKTWGPVFTMADTPGLPDCNPVLFVDAKQRLWLFWIPVKANKWERCFLKYRRADSYSGDGPPKWNWQDVIVPMLGDNFPEQLESGFKELGYEQSMWAEYALPYNEVLVEAAKNKANRQEGWMTRIHPLQLASGRIVLPLYSDGFNVSLTIYSDDTGETWQTSAPIIGLGPIQPALVQKKDGTVVAYMRDSGGAPPRVLRATSPDNAATWSVATDTDIPNPGSSLDVIALKDGRWVMIYNDEEDGRHSLALAISEDEGATWKAKRHLDRTDRGQGGFAYPSLIQARNGRIHATYTHSRSSGDASGKTIKHVALDPAWIEQRD